MHSLQKFFITPAGLFCCRRPFFWRPTPADSLKLSRESADIDHKLIDPVLRRVRHEKSSAMWYRIWNATGNKQGTILINSSCAHVFRRPVFQNKPPRDLVLLDRVRVVRPQRLRYVEGGEQREVGHAGGPNPAVPSRRNSAAWSIARPCGWRSRAYLQSATRGRCTCRLPASPVSQQPRPCACPDSPAAASPRPPGSKRAVQSRTAGSERDPADSRREIFVPVLPISAEIRGTLPDAEALRLAVIKKLVSRLDSYFSSGGLRAAIVEGLQAA